jgi:hypothetical protein
MYAQRYERNIHPFDGNTSKKKFKIDVYILKLNLSDSRGVGLNFWNCWKYELVCVEKMSDLYERIIVMAPFPEPLHMVTYCGTLCSGCILREYFVRIWSLFLGWLCISLSFELISSLSKLLITETIK